MSRLYRTLGVARRTDATGIKCAYRKMAKSWHPDLHGGDKEAEERFKAISLAYETLGDPQARALYDAACAQRRGRHLRRAAAAMTASFVLTLSTGALVGMWLLGEGVL